MQIKLVHISIIILLVQSIPCYGQNHYLDKEGYNRSTLKYSDFSDLNKTLYGKAVVTDGDSLKISNRRIRLLGIDAPELNQKCSDINGLIYPCGRISKDALIKKVSFKNVICYFKNTDRYGRVITVCWLDKVNINSWLVLNGYAVAYRRYSKAFIKDEMRARETKKGIWSGKFEKPEVWRRMNR